MRTKQLAALFINVLTVGTNGAITGALLPIYAKRLGADETLNGLYFSSTFAALALGTVVAGWLSDRFQRRKLFLLIAGVIQIIAFWLMGQITNFGAVFVVTFIAFVMLGVQLALVNILAGLFADESERGRVFGVLASVNPLGAVIGGVISGPIVDWWGFSGLFTAAALIAILSPLSALTLEDKRLERTERTQPANQNRSALLTTTFLLLFFANTFIFAANGVQGLGRALLMDKLDFDASAVAGTLAIGGLVGLPFPFVLGLLSDRIGRKPVLMFCYIAMSLSLFILAVSSVPWHFWLSTALQWIMVAGMGVGSAMVTDIVPAESLGAGLSWFGATNFIGLVIGSAATGAAIQSVGMVPTFIIGGLVALAGVGMVTLMQRSTARQTRDRQIVTML